MDRMEVAATARYALAGTGSARERRRLRRRITAAAGRMLELAEQVEVSTDEVEAAADEAFEALEQVGRRSPRARDHNDLLRAMASVTDRLVNIHSARQMTVEHARWICAAVRNHRVSPYGPATAAAATTQLEAAGQDDPVRAVGWLLTDLAVNGDVHRAADIILTRCEALVAGPRCQLLLREAMRPHAAPYGHYEIEPVLRELTDVQAATAAALAEGWDGTIVELIETSQAVAG